MSTYLRNNKAGSSDAAIDVVTDSWDLDAQLERLLLWLRGHPEIDFSSGEWVVDIGFAPWQGVTVAGYTVGVELMAILSKNNIHLWLSGYGKVANEDAQLTGRADG